MNKISPKSALAAILVYLGTWLLMVSCSSTFESEKTGGTETSTATGKTSKTATDTDSDTEDEVAAPVLNLVTTGALNPNSTSGATTVVSLTVDEGTAEIATVSISIQKSGGNCLATDLTAFTAACPNWIDAVSSGSGWTITLADAILTHGATYEMTGFATDVDDVAQETHSTGSFSWTLVPAAVSYLWRNFATTNARTNEYEIYVPYAYESGSWRYSVYAFQAYYGGVTHLGRMRDGVPVLNKWHTDGSVTKTGTWTTTANATAIPGPGTTARSNVAGDTIAASVTGHTVILRAYTNTNGGFALVAIDGDYTTATSLPAVAASDFKNVTGADDSTGSSGPIRVTAAAHGYSTGATVTLENVGGVAGANGTYTITVVDANRFTLDGTAFAGAYTSGGTVGFFAQADLGKRYIECYGVYSNFDEHFLAAEGLADASHAVIVRVKGTARAGGSTGKRLYLTGFAAASAGQVLTDTDVSMGYIRDVYTSRPVNSYSAFISAVTYNPATFANPQFIGEIHGNETQTALTWKVDGTTVTPAAGALNSGAVITLDRTSDYTHPSTAATVVATNVTTYSAGAAQTYGLKVAQTVTWQNAGTLTASYYGMLPVGLGNYAGANYTGSNFDAAILGSTTYANIADNDDTFKGQIQTDTAIFYHSSLHTLRVKMHMPDVSKNVNNWTNSGSLNAFIQDRSDKLDKVYFARSTAATPETITVGDVHENEVWYHIWRE